MSSKIKKIFTILFLAVISFFLNPSVSKAVSYSYPASTVYVEFVDQNGNDFPVTMGMEGTYVTGTVSGMSWDVDNLISATPLSITRVGGQNVFAISMPAFNGYTGTPYSIYAAYPSGLKVNTPLPFVKSFSISSTTNPGLPRTTRLDLILISNGSGGFLTNGFQMNNPSATKLPDDTFILSENTTGYTIGGYTSAGRLFFKNIGQFNGTNESIWLGGLEGNRLRFYANFYQVKEIFEDQSGVSIPAPSGYTNGKVTDITSQPFSYQMANDSGLPQTYVDGSFIYTYEGWYRGAGNRASIVTTHPPSINFNADLDDPKNEVHIVYNKKALRIIDEEYIDPSSATIDSTWNNLGQQKADGEIFTQTPALTKTDSSGAIWEYQGWKLGSEPMSAMKTTPVSHVINGNTTIQYIYKKKQHTMTEKWVDQADGSTLIPMIGNPKTSPIDDNDNFTGSATATITDSGNGIWDFVGWENVTDAPGTVNPATSYAINNIKNNKEIRYHYQARNTTATLDLNPTPQVTASGGNVSWSSRLTNTGTSTLNNLKLKATSNWASGLSEPVQVTVTPAGGTAQNFTVSPGDWTGGFNLTGINIPNAGPNNYADITFTTTATGAVNQVLPAEIEIDGNMASPLTAESFVRIDDPDEPNLKPSGNAGLINIPDFRFGDVEVKPYAQTKGLDAASYQSGYNPYIRFMDQESLSGWSLTAKLGQFTSGAKTLPTTTAIQLNNGDLKEVQNYNKDNESLSSIGSVGNTAIPSDGTTVALTNGAAQGVYQLDYAFGDVELDLLAHSGVAGLSYTADMDWTLTTAP